MNNKEMQQQALKENSPLGKLIINNPNVSKRFTESNEIPTSTEPPKTNDSLTESQTNNSLTESKGQRNKRIAFYTTADTYDLIQALSMKTSTNDTMNQLIDFAIKNLSSETKEQALNKYYEIQESIKNFNTKLF